MMHSCRVRTSSPLARCCSDVHLPSFPTRRSSDLRCQHHGAVFEKPLPQITGNRDRGNVQGGGVIVGCRHVPPTRLPGAGTRNPRSEEHTSELQSRFDLVCRLLLEKKNTHNHTLPT